MTRRVDREIADLVDYARECPSRDEFRAEGLRRLQSILGFDSGAFASIVPAVPTTLNKPAGRAESFAANFDRYARELEPLSRAALAGGGVAVDVRVLSDAARDRMHFYAEIARPQGVGALLAAHLTLRGETRAVLYLARHGRGASFDETGVDAVRALLPALSLGDAVHPAPAATPAVTPAPACAGIDWSRLSPREREVVEYVSLGLRNGEIALACGSSPNTVRNQLASVFQKLGVANRTELARVAAESGFLTRAR